MNWSLTIAGVTKTLADWGVSAVTLRRQNLLGDELVFTAPRAGFDDLLCAYGDPVTLLRDGVPWFNGTSQTIPEFADGQSQGQTYTIASPLRWLAENIFQQPWFNGTYYTSHIIFVGSAGNNIKAVLDYAIARGAAIQYSAADLAALAVFPPTNEFTEKTCLQCVLDNLQFAPDVVAWLDYSTTPATLRFQRRTTLPAVSLRHAGGSAAESLTPAAALTIRARPDLRIPSAKINFEIIDEIDGVQRLTPVAEVWPPGATGLEDGAFNAVLTVQGRSVTNVTGELECAQIDTADLEWWKSRYQRFRNPDVDVLTGPTNVRRCDELGNDLPIAYPRQLLPGGGSIAPWMTDGSGNPIRWQREWIKATFSYQTVTDGGTVNVVDEHEVILECITTNAPAGVSSYSAVESIDSGDPVPYGLARYLYESLSELHYEASFTLTQAECDGVVNLGRVVNLLGARPEHETMRALVQEITFDIDSGTTQVRCGPPRHLSLSDVLALLTRFRVRRRFTNPATQSTGELTTGTGEVELGRATGNTNTVPGISAESFYAVRSGVRNVSIDADRARATITNGQANIVSDAETGIISLTSSAAGIGSILISLAQAQGKNIALRSVPVCQNGVTKQIIVLASEIF